MPVASALSLTAVPSASAASAAAEPLGDYVDDVVVRLPHPHPDGRRRLDAAVYRRRRLAVAAVALLALALLWSGARVVGGPGRAAEDRPGGVSAPASGTPTALVHVVRPGDTVWAVARALQPEGEVRHLVDAVVAANGGSPVLRVGQELVLPVGGR